VRLDKLWLTDFRSYESAELPLAPGLTAILGPNGRGKTNLLEAVGWLATLSSFRGAPNDVLVRAGAASAVLRCEGTVERPGPDGAVAHTGRSLLIEAEIAGSRPRVLVNKQRLARARDLLGHVRVTVFAPEDLELVKGGPSERRRYLDDLLVSLHPRYDLVRTDVDRVLRQRNALLKQVRGRLDESAELTLDVFDAKLGAAGEELARLRVALVERLEPAVRASYAAVAVGADTRAEVGLAHDSAWHGRDGGLTHALAAARADDLRRGSSTVGPHRDDVALTIGGLPARSHASQGEQRSLAVALRLASHQVVTETVGMSPVLLLDDIFSELDPGRCDALLEALPPGQALLTSASGMPPGARPEQVLHVTATDLPGGGVRSSVVHGPPPGDQR
jgi:DNA replication and repair protein RecF